MIPSGLICIVLALGAYRLTRFGGWDDWPPIVRLRARVLGETWVPVEGDEPELPGKTPSSEVPTVRPAYRRPLLAHLVHCPFCLSFWVSIAVYGLWLWQPRVTLYLIAPWALSGAVGIISKNLDP